MAGAGGRQPVAAGSSTRSEGDPLSLSALSQLSLSALLSHTVQIDEDFTCFMHMYIRSCMHMHMHMHMSMSMSMSMVRYVVIRKCMRPLSHRAYR